LQEGVNGNIMKCSPHQSERVNLSRPFCPIRLFITLLCREHNRFN